MPALKDVDEFMGDWRETFMLQASPEATGKIASCVEDISKEIGPSDTVLDVGCGQGVLYGDLKGGDYLGIDLSPDEIAAARRRHPLAKFEVGDLFTITGKWDVVVCSRVLLHIAPLGDAMKALFRLARKRLCLVVHTGDKNSVQRCDRAEGKYYFRMIAEDTLRSYGPCVITPHKRYSSVIYSLEADGQSLSIR